MPRQVAFLASQFRDEVDKALEIVRAIERVRFSLPSAPTIQRDLTSHRIELIYELAYLRIFLFWENFLEESFERYLCGYANSTGRQTLISGSFYKRTTDANQAIRAFEGGRRQYVLWHSADRVVARSQNFFRRGQHEIVINSNLSRLRDFSYIRHRIAHLQDDARRKFDRASMTVCGRRFIGAKAGKLLRYKSSPTERWIEVIARELSNLAGQIAP
jgi:hypothetical protein